MENDKWNEENAKKQIKLYAKVLQALFLALFMLGASTGIGDAVAITNLPFSPFSVTSMTYGVLGMIGCEYVARQFSS